MAPSAVSSLTVTTCRVFGMPLLVLKVMAGLWSIIVRTIWFFLVGFWWWLGINDRPTDLSNIIVILSSPNKGVVAHPWGCSSDLGGPLSPQKSNLMFPCFR